MFKRALLAIAIMGMVSAPAMADLHGSLDQPATNPNLQLSNPGGPGTIGVLNTLGTFASSNLMLYPNNSDVITVTFALHQPYQTPLIIERNRNGLRFDTSEVVILGAGPAGPFVSNNIGATPAMSAAAKQAAGEAAINGIVGATSLSSGVLGTVGVIGIEQFPVSPFILSGSSTVPFFRVTFHAKGPFAADSLMDLFTPEQGTDGAGGITFGVGMIYRTFTTSQVHTTFSNFVTNINPGATLFITGGGATRPSYGVKLEPEPASAALLGMGVLAMTGGFWRRRRRQA